MPTLCNEADIEEFDAAAFFEKSLAAQEEWAKRNPTPRHIERVIETDKPVAVVFTSDWHIGGVGTLHRKLRDDMLHIANHERLFAYVGGDWGNNFIVGRLVMAGLNDVFAAGDQQYEVTRLIFEPLATSNSCIAVASGNHDSWLMQAANLDPRWLVFRGVPHLCVREGAVMHLTVGEQTYRIFRRHRPRWGSIFNPAHAVVTEYQRNPFEFDVGIIEHQHMSHYALFDGKERDAGGTDRIAIRPGTYKLDDAYAEERGFYYASNELVSVIFWPDRFQMQPVKGLHELTEIVDALG